MASSHAPAEWRLLAWLEREGFAYDLFADQQLHDGTLDLAAYRVLVISVHPEYWSRPMLERVRRWVEDGGRFVVLGGNCVNCEVELADDGRSMRCLTQLTSTDGSLGMPDGPTRTSGMTAASIARRVAEASLLGLATTETGIMTGAPYRVADGASDHWAFAGPGFATGTCSGRRACTSAARVARPGTRRTSAPPRRPPPSGSWRRA